MAERSRQIFTARAPAPVGPYSQALERGGMLFVSGQLGMAPESGEMAAGVEEQTRRALQNLTAVVESAGYHMTDLIKTTCFLANMDDFPVFNGIYGEFVGDPPPARSCVAVRTLPKGALVEVEAIAVKPE